MTQDEYSVLYQQSVDYYRQLGHYDTENMALYNDIHAPRVADELNNSSVKGLFPRSHERIILTNGRESVVLSSESTEQDDSATWNLSQYGQYRTVAETNQYIFEAYVKLKATAPGLPVYEVHNHPALSDSTQASRDKLVAYGVPVEELNRIGNIPSAGDIQKWKSYGNLIKGAIYIQDIDSVVSYTDDWSESANYATQIALDYVPARAPDPDLSMFVPDEGSPEKWLPRIAPEGESMPGTVYIPFDKWDEEKDKYNIDWWSVSDWIKK